MSNVAQGRDWYQNDIIKYWFGATLETRSSGQSRSSFNLRGLTKYHRTPKPWPPLSVSTIHDAWSCLSLSPCHLLTRSMRYDWYDFVTRSLNRNYSLRTTLDSFAQFRWLEKITFLRIRREPTKDRARNKWLFLKGTSAPILDTC